MDQLNRIEQLRNKRASLAAEKSAAEKGRSEAEAQLREMGWDGVQPIDQYVASLETASNVAKEDATIALNAAEELAKEFE